MEFTRDEFWRGATAAWCVFMILLAVFLVVAGIRDSGPPWGPPVSMSGMYLAFGMPIGGIVAALIGLLASPGAWGLGRALARSANVLTHLCAYFGFGVLLGATTAALTALIAGASLGGALTSGFTTLIAAGCGISVVLGWSFAVWHASRPRWRRSRSYRTLASERS